MGSVGHGWRECWCLNYCWLPVRGVEISSLACFKMLGRRLPPWDVPEKDGTWCRAEYQSRWQFNLQLHVRCGIVKAWGTIRSDLERQEWRSFSRKWRKCEWRNFSQKWRYLSSGPLVLTFGGLRCFCLTFSRCFGQTKTFTSLNPIKMVDSLLLRVSCLARCCSSMVASPCKTTRRTFSVISI
jgi:hypothetical protein